MAGREGEGNEMRKDENTNPVVYGEDPQSKHGFTWGVEGLL